MTPTALLADLRDAGVEFRLAGVAFQFRDPAGALTPELRQAITAAKPELLSLLRAEAEPAPELPAFDLCPYAALLAAAREGTMPPGPAPLGPGLTAVAPAAVALGAAAVLRSAEREPQ